MSITCLRSVALGGEFQATADQQALLLVPDDQPGKVIRVIGGPGNTTRIPRFIRSYGSRGRAAFSGALMSDDSLISDGGAGALRPNQNYVEQPRGDCPQRIIDAFGVSSPEPETAVAIAPPWEGLQRVSINLDPPLGIPENVLVYGVDGNQYRVDTSASNQDQMKTLATIAPQGSPLGISGRWDPTAKMVRVDDWYIWELGAGAQEYGIDETGLVAPRAGIPTTANPGGMIGAPATYAEQAAAAAGNTPETGSMRDNLLLVAAILAALRLLEVI